MATILLPTKDRSFSPYTTGEPIVLPKGSPPKFNRVAYAAAHVVADPLADNDPWLDASVDWDKTIAFREYLWDLGLGVAEAMDTAQRGMGLDWSGAKELIRRALEAARRRPRAKTRCGEASGKDGGLGCQPPREGERCARAPREGPRGLRARLRPYPAAGEAAG